MFLNYIISRWITLYLFFSFVLVSFKFSGIITDSLRALLSNLFHYYFKYFLNKSKVFNSETLQKYAWLSVPNPVFLLERITYKPEAHMILYCLSVKEKLRVMVFNATFNNISVISWWSVLLVGKPEYTEKPPTCRKWLTNFITCYIECTSPWTWFELTTLVVIGTDCTCSCKSNYHTITTTTAPSGKDLLKHWIFYEDILSSDGQ